MAKCSVISMSNLDVKWQLSPGRPRDFEVEQAIPVALQNIRLGTQETIRKELIRILGRQVSWHTVNSHLESGVKQGTIQKRIVSEGTRRTIAVFSISA